MSDGHGDGGGCGYDGHATCAEPVAGDGNVGIVAAAPAGSPVIDGIEVNRAKIIELSKQRLIPQPR